MHFKVYLDKGNYHGHIYMLVLYNNTHNTHNLDTTMLITYTSPGNPRSVSSSLPVVYIILKNNYDIFIIIHIISYIEHYYVY